MREHQQKQSWHKDKGPDDAKAMRQQDLMFKIIMLLMTVIFSDVLLAV